MLYRYRMNRSLQTVIDVIDIEIGIQSALAQVENANPEPMLDRITVLQDAATMVYTFARVEGYRLVRSRFSSPEDALKTCLHQLFVFCVEQSDDDYPPDQLRRAANHFYEHLSNIKPLVRQPV